MNRTNLATRPFYNERAVQSVLIGALVVVGLATAFNATRIITLSRSDTRLATQATADEARAAELRRSAAGMRASVNPKDIELASVEARRANDLIDRRTFSWTELFNRFEATLPDDVRLAAIRPKIDRDRGIVLSINVIAKGNDDVSQFMDNLETTGAFRELIARDERFNDQGQLEASLESVYSPGTAKPPAPATAPAGADSSGATPAVNAATSSAPAAAPPAAAPAATAPAKTAPNAAPVRPAPKPVAPAARKGAATR